MTFLNILDILGYAVEILFCISVIIWILRRGK